MNALSVVQKAARRGEALTRRDALPVEERAAKSARIVERLSALVAELKPASVAGYLAIRSEADIEPLLLSLRARRIPIALPALSGGGILFYEWREGDALETVEFGLRQPAADAPGIVPELILAPMVAFDRFGRRLGYGRGHYDRALAAMRDAGYVFRIIGVAFAAQEVAPIPIEPHDILLDGLVTEDETLTFPS